jgi:hypothetical protein
MIEVSEEAIRAVESARPGQAVIIGQRFRHRAIPGGRMFVLVLNETGMQVLAGMGAAAHAVCDDEDAKAAIIPIVDTLAGLADFGARAPLAPSTKGAMSS